MKVCARCDQRAEFSVVRPIVHDPIYGPVHWGEGRVLERSARPEYCRPHAEAALSEWRQVNE